LTDNFQPIGRDTCDKCKTVCCLVALSHEFFSKSHVKTHLLCINCFLQVTIRHGTEKRCSWCKMLINENPIDYEEKIVMVDNYEYYHQLCNWRRSNKMTKQSIRRNRYSKIYPKIVEWLIITSSIATIVTLYVFMIQSPLS